jgi:hypothetical protein
MLWTKIEGRDLGEILGPVAPSRQVDGQGGHLQEGQQAVPHRRRRGTTVHQDDAEPISH